MLPIKFLLLPFLLCLTIIACREEGNGGLGKGLGGRPTEAAYEWTNGTMTLDINGVTTQFQVTLAVNTKYGQFSITTEGGPVSSLHIGLAYYGGAAHTIPVGDPLDPGGGVLLELGQQPTFINTGAVLMNVNIMSFFLCEGSIETIHVGNGGPASTILENWSFTLLP